VEQERIALLLLCVYLFVSFSLFQQGHLQKVMKVDEMAFAGEKCTKNKQKVFNHGKYNLTSESKMP
jgi:hypothetical protein